MSVQTPVGSFDGLTFWISLPMSSMHHKRGLCEMLSSSPFIFFVFSLNYFKFFQKCWLAVIVCVWAQGCIIRSLIRSQWHQSSRTRQLFRFLCKYSWRRQEPDIDFDVVKDHWVTCWFVLPFIRNEVVNSGWQKKSFFPHTLGSYNFTSEQLCSKSSYLLFFYMCFSVYGLAAAVVTAYKWE